MIMVIMLMFRCIIMTMTMIINMIILLWLMLMIVIAFRTMCMIIFVILSELLFTVYISLIFILKEKLIGNFKLCRVNIVLLIYFMLNFYIIKKNLFYCSYDYLNINHLLNIQEGCFIHMYSINYLHIILQLHN